MITSQFSNTIKRVSSIFYKLGTSINPVRKSLNYSITHVNTSDNGNNTCIHHAKEHMYNMGLTFSKENYRPDDILQLVPARPNTYLLDPSNDDIIYHRDDTLGLSLINIGQDNLYSINHNFDTTNDHGQTSIMFPIISNSGNSGNSGGDNTYGYDNITYPTYEEYIEKRNADGFFVEFPTTTIYGLRYIGYKLDVGHFDNEASIIDEERKFHNILREYPHKYVRSNYVQRISFYRYNENDQQYVVNADIYDSTIIFDTPLTINNLMAGLDHVYYLQYYTKPSVPFVKDIHYNGILLEEKDIPLTERSRMYNFGKDIDTDTCPKKQSYINEQINAIDKLNNIGVGGIIRFNIIPQLDNSYNKLCKHYPASKYVRDPEKTDYTNVYSPLIDMLKYTISDDGIVSNNFDNRRPISFIKTLSKRTLIQECLWIRSKCNPFTEPNLTTTINDICAMDLLIEGYNTKDEDNIWRLIDILTFDPNFNIYQQRTNLSYHRTVDQLRFTILSLIPNTIDSYAQSNGYRPLIYNNHYKLQLDIRYRYLYIPELLFFTTATTTTSTTI